MKIGAMVTAPDGQETWVVTMPWDQIVYEKTVGKLGEAESQAEGVYMMLFLACQRVGLVNGISFEQWAKTWQVDPTAAPPDKPVATPPGGSASKSPSRRAGHPAK